MSMPPDSLSMSFQLDSSGAWIDLAEPPGANADIQVATLGRQISEGSNISFASAISSSQLPLHELGVDTAATRRIEAELSAALAARSFVNGIVIGNILTQSQKKHTEHPGEVSQSPGGEMGVKGKQDSRLSPAKAKGNQRLAVGKSAAFRANDRPRSSSLKESSRPRWGSRSPSPGVSPPQSPTSDKDRRAASKRNRSQRDARYASSSSVASQEDVQSKTEASARKRPSQDSSSSSTFMQAEQLHGDYANASVGRVIDDLGSNAEIGETSAAILEGAQEVTVNSQLVPQFAEVAQNLYFGGWSSLAAESLCGLEVIGGQHLGGLHLEAELPSSLAGLFGFPQYQSSSNNGAVAKTHHAENDAVSFAGFGHDFHSDYSQQFMYGTDGLGYPSPFDYGHTRAVIDDHMQHIQATSANIARIDETFDTEEPPQASIPGERSLLPARPSSPLESVSEVPKKARESVKMPKLNFPVSHAKPKQKPHTARAEVKRSSLSPAPPSETSANEERPSPPSAQQTRRRRIPPMHTHTNPATANDEDVYIYHLSARPAVPLTSRHSVGDVTRAMEGELDHSISHEHVETSIDIGDASGEQDRIAMARSHSNKLLSRLSRQGDHGVGRPKPQGRPSGLIGSARISRDPSNPSVASKRSLAPLNPHLRALMTSQKPFTSDSKGTLATVRTVSTRVGGSSQDSSRTLPKADKVNGLSPVEAAKHAHWKRHRERQWDPSFATMAGQGIPDLLKADRALLHSHQSEENRATSAPVAHEKLPEGSQLSWTQSQEMAAHWAISLAVNPLRPVTVPSASSTLALGKNHMSDMLSKFPKRDISQDFIEWYGSPLHQAFLQSLEQQRENQQDPEAGEAGMALFAIEDQLERTHGELRDLLEEHVTETSQIQDAAFSMQIHFLLEVLLNEMQIPNRYRQPTPKENFSEVDLLVDHASEILAFRDTTVRIIGGLVDRDRVQAARNELSPASDDGEDAEAQHLAQISQALHLGISTWCRHFGHFAQFTCGQVAGETRSSLVSTSPSKDKVGQAAVFLWCGQDAQNGLQNLQAPSESTPSKTQNWPASEIHTLGEKPQSQQAPSHGARVPGFRTQDRASRSATRGLRALLRGGIGAAGQYVTSKNGPPRLNDIFDQR